MHIPTIATRCLSSFSLSAQGVRSEMRRFRRDLTIRGLGTADHMEKNARMSFPCGNPFVLPATRCTLNYKRTLLLVEGKIAAETVRQVAEHLGRFAAESLVQGAWF